MGDGKEVQNVVKINGNSFQKKLEVRCFTNETLAKEAGVSPTTVQKARNGGEIRPTTLGKLAKALKCKPETLVKD